MNDPLKDISVSKRIKYGNDLCTIIVPAQLHMLCFDSSAHTACLNNSELQAQASGSRKQ